MITEKEYLYWLFQMPHMGAAKIRKMKERFGSFCSIYNIEETELKAAEILNSREIEQFFYWKRRLDDSRKEYHSLGASGIRFITAEDREYPQRLLRIYNYPMGLYIKGRLPDENRKTAAVIGARSCSPYGKQMAYHMGKLCGEAGIQVISGMALGIDGEGHRGALDAGGDTFGVLGCGINICYPKENYYLMERLVEKGGVISEFPLGEPPKPGNFPMRNRIISGLSDAVLVIEAREKSGSLITAELGLEQGKDIFAVPGRVTDPLSAGCNKLIRDGAGILTEPSDFVDYFGIEMKKTDRLDKKRVEGLAKNEKMVYACLDLVPRFLEQIASDCQMSVQECMRVLLELEIKGMVEETTGHYYVRTI